MTAHNGTPAFDLAHIDAQWGSASDDIYRSILDIFAEEGEELCAEARASLSAGRRDLLARAAHTLRGASANVGALHLAYCAGMLQESAQSAAEGELQKLVQAVETAWLTVREEIAMGGPRAHD